MQNLKQRTTAQVAAFHTLESAGIGVGISVLVAAVQYLSTNGLNVTGLGTAAGGTFVGAMLMMYKSLIMNSQVISGAKDTVGQGWQFIQAELRNITNALTGGKPIPAQLPTPTSPMAIDVQSLAQELANALMKTRPQQAPIPPRPQVDQLPTQPQVDVVRAPTPPPVQPAPLYAPNPTINATATQGSGYYPPPYPGQG